MVGRKEECLWGNVCSKSNGLNLRQWIEKHPKLLRVVRSKREKLFGRIRNEDEKVISTNNLCNGARAS
jgi:hypothetical protein